MEFYDHLLIIGTLCGFIKGMTNAWLTPDTDILGGFTEVQQEKLSVHGNPRKGIISVRADFFAFRDAEFCVPKIPVNFNWI